MGTEYKDMLGLFKNAFKDIVTRIVMIKGETRIVMIKLTLGRVIKI